MEEALDMLKPVWRKSEAAGRGPRDASTPPLDWTGPIRAGLGRIGLGWIGLGRVRLGWAGRAGLALKWNGSGWSGPDRAGLRWVG